MPSKFCKGERGSKNEEKEKRRCIREGGEGGGEFLCVFGRERRTCPSFGGKKQTRHV